AIALVGRNRTDLHRAEHAAALAHEVRFDRTRIGLAEKAAQPRTQRRRYASRVDERRGTRCVNGLRRRARPGPKASREEVLATLDAVAFARRGEREEVGRPAAPVRNDGEGARRLPAWNLDRRLAALRRLSLFCSWIA